MAKLSGGDKAVVIFNAPDVTQNTQYVVNLTVSDGTLSSTAVLYAECEKRRPPLRMTKIRPPAILHGQQPEMESGDIVNGNGALYQCKPFGRLMV